MKYGSEGFEGCGAEELLAVSLRSVFELLIARLCDESPTYKRPNQQNPPCAMI